MAKRRVRDREFLRFAHSTPILCRICKKVPAQQLHHFGSGGMGLKGSDYLIVRVCQNCHERARKVIAMKRDNDWETLATFYEDATELMQLYIRRLKLQAGDEPY